MGSLLARVDQPLMKDAYKAKQVFMWVYGAASGKTSDRGKIYSSFHIYADCGLVTFLEHKHIVYENIALGRHIFESITPCYVGFRAQINLLTFMIVTT